jgi:hypothetical protein
MNEVVVINSFRNHDSLFYLIKNLMSIPGISLKITVLSAINRKFNFLSPIILLYYLRIYLIIAGFLQMIFRYISKFFSVSNKAGEKKFNSRLLGEKFCQYYLCAFLKCERCINRGEPAAVLVSHIKIKVGEFKVPESAAVGSPGVVIGHLSLGRRFGAMMRFCCMDTGGMGRW